MTYIDIFNGDADGICALTQLRHAQPRDSRLVTGVKRDIALVAKASAADGDELTVLDISFDTNRAGVQDALRAGASVFYADHHFAGEALEHARLTTLIDTRPDTCTSLIVNRHLDGRYAAWAVTGAFGDNLGTAARSLASSLSLSARDMDVLERLGTLINYNGYGASLLDLHFAPDDLFARVRPYESPLDFVRDAAETFEQLEDGYTQDMHAVGALAATTHNAHGAVFMLPDEAWARRVSGVYSNDLVNQHPDRAHAVITARSDGTYLVSVRAPLSNKTGADELVRAFPTGGGRAAAAGINNLPPDQLDAFIDAFTSFFTR